jgi:hypothetical protein
MDFLALSLPEAAYLYAGLAVQALLRSSSLRLLPAVIVIIAIFYLLSRGGLNVPQRAYAPVIGYASVSTLILVLFWPEAVGRLGGINSQTSPHQTASYAATQDPGAVILTAQATGLVPAPLQTPVLLPTGLRLLLRAFTETHLELAKAINSQTHRTFAPVVPMQWLLTQKLSGEAQAAVRDFVHGCYLPAKARLLQRAEALSVGVTFQELLPWGGSELQQELTRVEVTPGAQTGLGARIHRFLGLGGELPAIRCDAYILTTVQRVMDWLTAQHTQRGTPLSQVFQQELGLPAETQAQFLLYREMLRAAGPEVPAPSLTGVYLGLRGVGLLGSIAHGAGEGRIAGGTGAAIGAKLGALRGAGNELQRILDGISSLVGIAVFLTWWGPYILGMVNLVVLGLFPIVAIWSLFPQAQFRPLATYFAVLFFTTASPLWWALADEAARLAHSAAQGGTPSLFSELVEWGNGWVAYHVVTALGILLIPIITGLLIFGSWRAIGGFWRGIP